MGSERALGMEQCGGGISHVFWRPDCGGCGTRSWHVNEMKQNCVDAAMAHKYAEDWYFQSSFDMCWYRGPFYMFPFYMGPYFGDTEPETMWCIASTIAIHPLIIHTEANSRLAWEALLSGDVLRRFHQRSEWCLQ